MHTHKMDHTLRGKIQDVERVLLTTTKTFTYSIMNNEQFLERNDFLAPIRYRFLYPTCYY